MFINYFDPVAFEIFSLEIRWYSLAYIIGILIGWILSKRIFISDDGLKEKFDDYITYIILGIIVGGRLGYVLLYNFGYYSNNLIEIFKIWQGGMSFHGGLIGIILVSIYFAKKNKHNVFKYLDIIAIVAPIGIFFGRIANFINSELYGFETSLPWAVKFIKVDNLYRHPTQLYEAFFEGLILFLIFYSIFRFSIEFFRVPDEQLGYLFFSLTMGQIMSFIFLLVGSYLVITKYNNKNES